MAKKPAKPKAKANDNSKLVGAVQDAAAGRVNVSKLDLPFGPVRQPAGSRLKKPKGGK
jgi:hypothetical protein